MYAIQENILNDHCPSNHTRPFFQTKLSVNEPGDAYEQEADAMVNKVMNMPADVSSGFFKPAAAAIKRKCKDCEEEGHISHQTETNGHVSGKKELNKYVDSLDSSGQPLPDTSRQIFEPRFGHDFSDVRIHTDNAAARSAQSVNALAYTTGKHIVFNQGQYAPDNTSGQKLMAHELTHVVQQNNGAGSSKNIQRQDDKKDDSPFKITKRLQLPAPDIGLPQVLASPEKQEAEDQKAHPGIDFSRGLSANPPLSLRPETYALSLVYRDFDIRPGDDNADISVDLGHEPNFQLTLSPDPHNAQIYQAAIALINIHFKRHKKEFIELSLSPQFSYAQPSGTFSAGAQAQAELHITSKFSLTVSSSISGTKHDSTAPPDYSSVPIGTSHGVDWSWAPVNVGLLWHLGK